jgi:Holliday junction resolvase-like predicted endonuclease
MAVIVGSMRTSAQRAGDLAEARATAHLEQVGWTILAAHLRVGRDELDVLAIDPGPPRSLVAVEVRWRARRDFGLPEETVDHRKRARSRRATFALLDAGRLPAGTPLPALPLRLDLIVVEPGGRLRHYRHAA